MNRYKIGLISLGCDKNRIDSELLLGKLNEKNDIVNDPNKADIIIEIGRASCRERVS